MIALQITDIGLFMNRLLKDGIFDHFLLQEAVVAQAVTYHIDGTVNTDFFDENEGMPAGMSGLKYIPFERVRPICFELIRGKKKPGYFKFVFLLSPENQKNTVERSGSSFQDGDITAMYINLIYRNNALLCTTGIACRLFSLDKTLDREWNRLVQVFFKQHGIPFEQQS